MVVDGKYDRSTGTARAGGSDREQEPDVDVSLDRLGGHPVVGAVGPGTSTHNGSVRRELRRRGVIASAAAAALIPFGHLEVPAASSTSAWTSKVPLAVVVNKNLEILRSGSVRTVAADLTIDRLIWSPDARWLMVEEFSSLTGDQTWVVRADGTYFHEVDRASGQVAAWGAADTIIIGAPSANGATSSIGQFDPATGTHTLLTTVRGDVQSIAATSTSIAIASSVFAGSNGFARGSLLLFRLGARRLTTVAQSQVDAYGSLSFSPNGADLVYDLDPDNSSSLAQDGVEFELTRVGTPGAHALGLGLEVPSWQAWSPSSSQLDITLGGSRAAWSTSKHIDRCSTVEFHCSNLTTVRGTVAFEPSISPTSFAYVTATGLGGSNGFGSGSPGSSLAAISAWVDTFRIWVAQGDRPAQELTTLGTASDPEWIDGGPGLLFVRNGELWTLASTPSKPVEITAPFLPESDQNYGTFDWSGSYALAP
jgi:hypothetical protein